MLNQPYDNQHKNVRLSINDSQHKLNIVMLIVIALALITLF